MRLRRIGCCVGPCVLALWVTGCTVAGPGGNQNTNDNGAPSNGNQSNNNGNDNGDGDDIEAGVEIMIPNEGQDHVPVGRQVTYQANPPASGPHWSAAGIAPVAAGVYETAQEEEQWVHNIEHGYVVLLYDCRGQCELNLLDELQALFDAAPASVVFGDTKLVITPYDGLPFSFAVVAWDRQLHLRTLDEEAVLDFYVTHVDQGPEAAP